MGARLLLLVAAVLAATGLFAIGQALTGRLLPHDEAWLGLTAAELERWNEGRIVGFMAHDRASFGGTLVAVAILYAWLVLRPLVRGEGWAWCVLAASGAAGFASFLAWLGFGYLDTWHGLATLALLPVFVAGLVLTRPRTVRPAVPSMARLARGLAVLARRPSSRRAGILGQCLVVLACLGMIAGGLTILAIGATVVFVPEDLAYMRADVAMLCAIDAGLVPLIAHDRAGFGGGLVATGIAAFGVAVCGRPTAGRWAVLASAGAVGFGAALGIHVLVGYLDLVHLGPAVLGAVVLAIGLGLSGPRGRQLDGHEPTIAGRDRLVGTRLVDELVGRRLVAEHLLLESEQQAPDRLPHRTLLPRPAGHAGAGVAGAGSANGLGRRTKRAATLSTTQPERNRLRAVVVMGRRLYVGALASPVA